jgi:flavin reductase (DIM6/NTAB) family NADH-FMN oxidoreductase RutF
VTQDQLSATFKAAMRRHPVGVTVVTSLREGEPRGLTLSAFTSVSADPPIVLVCVNRDARSYLYISESRIFCVNLLAAQQRDLAQRFASGMRDRQFEGLGYVTAVTGAPVLDGSIGYFDCEVTHEHHAGSHSIFLGAVRACESRPGRPLGYYEGEFQDFAPHGVQR